LQTPSSIGSLRTMRCRAPFHHLSREFTMTRTLLAAALAAVMAALPLAALAQGTDQAKKDAARAKWESMTPEEQAAAKAKAKGKWESMTPEEQAAAKKRFAERRAAKASPPAAPAAPASAPATK